MIDILIVWIVLWGSKEHIITCLLEVFKMRINLQSKIEKQMIVLEKCDVLHTFLVYGQRLIFQVWGCFCKKLMSQLYMQVLTRLALSFCLLCLKANVLLSSFITGTQSTFLRFYSNWFCFRPNQALKQSKPDSKSPHPLTAHCSE